MIELVLSLSWSSFAS